MRTGLAVGFQVGFALLGVCAWPLPVAAALAAAVPSHAVPTPAQLLYQQRELSMFLHFSMCTFAGCEQNTCDANPPSLFDPGALDATQWVETAVALGAKQICLTARHSGGFALWPSKHTNYSVKASPWRAGKGDVVAEFVAACRAGGISPCLYFIADWDCHNANESAEVYLGRQQGMLGELLSNYGTIDRLWLDLSVCHRRAIAIAIAMPPPTPPVSSPFLPGRSLVDAPA